MRKLINVHSSADRALNFSVVFNIHLTIDYESYGGTESLRCMMDDKVVYHSSRSNVIAWLCGKHNTAIRILSLLKAENINFSDEVAAIKSLSETVRPKQNIDFYIQYIKPISHEIEI